MIESSSIGGAHIWLRKNITETQETDGNGVELTVYEADEIHFMTDAIPTVTEVEASFSLLWALHESDSLTDRELIEEKVAALTSAIAELGDLVGSEV